MQSSRLGIWQGEYFGGPAAWLRAWDWNGSLILSSEELKVLERQSAEYERNRAEQERIRAEHERNRAEMERIRADKLAERLRELGVNPDTDTV